MFDALVALVVEGLMVKVRMPPASWGHSPFYCEQAIKTLSEP